MYIYICVNHIIYIYTWSDTEKTPQQQFICYVNTASAASCSPCSPRDCEPWSSATRRCTGWGLLDVPIPSTVVTWQPRKMPRGEQPRNCQSQNAFGKNDTSTWKNDVYIALYIVQFTINSMNTYIVYIYIHYTYIYYIYILYYIYISSHDIRILSHSSMPILRLLTDRLIVWIWMVCWQSVPAKKNDWSHGIAWKPANCQANVSANQQTNHPRYSKILDLDLCDAKLDIPSGYD